MLGALAEAVAATPLAAWAAGSALAYPLANVVHLLGLVMLVGGIGIVDLRLAGAFRSLPPAELSRVLTPVALAGLALMLLSGAILFAADTAVARSETFRLKLLLIGLALANAMLFRWLWRSRLPRWAEDPPMLGRAMAAVSLLLWLAVGTAGRMIAYS